MMRTLRWGTMIALAFLLVPSASNAQDWYTAVTYQISFPTGDTKTFADNTSFRGIGLDFRKTIAPNRTFGILGAWNVFYERVNDTTELENGAATGLQDRTVNAFPIMLTAHQYFGRRGGPRPYVGLGAGGFIFTQRFEIGGISTQNDRWDWGIAPEVGVLVRLRSQAVLIINGKFNYAFTGKNLADENINHSCWGLNAGFAWRQ